MDGKGKAMDGKFIFCDGYSDVVRMWEWNKRTRIIILEVFGFSPRKAKDFGKGVYILYLDLMRI